MGSPTRYTIRSHALCLREKAIMMLNMLDGDGGPLRARIAEALSLCEGVKTADLKRCRVVPKPAVKVNQHGRPIKPVTGGERGGG